MLHNKPSTQTEINAEKDIYITKATYTENLIQHTTKLLNILQQTDTTIHIKMEHIGLIDQDIIGQEQIKHNLHHIIKAAKSTTMTEKSKQLGQLTDILQIQPTQTAARAIDSNKKNETRESKLTGDSINLDTQGLFTLFVSFPSVGSSRSFLSLYHDTQLRSAIEDVPYRIPFYEDAEYLQRLQQRLTRHDKKRTTLLGKKAGNFLQKYLNVYEVEQQ